MLRPLKRLSLVAQSAATLRAHIGSRSAGETLPSERALCVQLGISRMTLRAALARLADEGLIRRAKGKRHSIVVTEPGRSPATSRDVIILSPLPLHSLDPRIIFWIDELREALAKEGYKLEFLQRQIYYSKHPAHALENLVAQLRPAAWLLYLSTREMQGWFSDRGLPAIIPGSRYPEVKLPSVDVDYRATCRHAAGQLLARGHERVALLGPRSAAGGDLESERAFQEATAKVGGIVVYHDGSVSSVCSQLDKLRGQPRPITGFLVSRPAHALTALCHLVRRGVRFPKDAVLIARDHDSFLEHAVPSPARYQVDPVLFAHKLSRLVIEIASGGDTRARDYRVMPSLIPGDTLGG